MSEISQFVPLANWPRVDWQTRRQIAAEILRARGDWRATLLAMGNPNANELVIVAG